MPNKRPTAGKKYFTITEANSTLPLVRAICRDIIDLANDLRERNQRMQKLRDPHKGPLGQAYLEEIEQMETDFEMDQERLQNYIEELTRLGVELKDPFTGLVDFLAWMDGREVYLCWRLGEEDVAHWHDLEAGFAGRQKLMVDSHRR